MTGTGKAPLPYRAAPPPVELAPILEPASDPSIDDGDILEVTEEVRGEVTESVARLRTTDAPPRSVPPPLPPAAAKSVRPAVMEVMAFPPLRTPPPDYAVDAPRSLDDDSVDVDPDYWPVPRRRRRSAVPWVVGLAIVAIAAGLYYDRAARGRARAELRAMGRSIVHMVSPKREPPHADRTLAQREPSAPVTIGALAAPYPLVSAQPSPVNVAWVPPAPPSLVTFQPSAGNETWGVPNSSASPALHPAVAPRQQASERRGERDRHDKRR